jgi:amino acid permease
MTSTTTWRSPLSILMGARRNDDSDLELRQDLFRPTPPSTPAAERRSKSRSSSTGGFTAYIPFGYFGSNSAAPAHTDMDASPNTPSAHPPLGAFPPPISPSSMLGDNNVTEENHEHVDHHQYTASHPWYNNKLVLTDSHDEENDNPDEHNNDLPEQNTEINETIIDNKWDRQKAIIGTTFNFTNSIIGAGAMGLGGAFAASGGFISIICLVAFAYLVKLSLDLIVDLSSSPDIIDKARCSNDSCDDNDCGSDRSSYYESPKFSEFNGETEWATSKQYVHDTSSPVTSISKEQRESNQVKIEDDKPSPQVESDSSPLMAQEEGIESMNDRNDDPTRINGHPLLLPHEKERYDSLVTDLTQPKPFSPLLHMSISTDNNTHQRDPLTRNTADDTFIPPCTYEELGRAAYGSNGRLAVLVCKSMYSFGCLIAYIVVVRDNFGPALRRIINSDNGNWLNDDNFLAFWVSALIMLPLSCPRTMKPLAKFSFVSVLAIVFLVLVVIYLYFSCVNPHPSEDSSFYTNWIEIRSLMGFIESLGTFVFTFVCHHTVNLAYESLPQSIQTPQTWRKVSTYSIVLATESSLAIGIFAYLTFGSETPADVLLGYPADLTLANVARLLLCLTMILTFPLPFLTCREMMVLILVDAHNFYYTNHLQRYNPCRPVFGEFKILRRKLWTRLFKPSENRENREKRHQEPNNIHGDANVEMEVEEPPRSTPWWKWKLGRAKAINADLKDEWWDGVNDATQALLPGQERRDTIISSIGGENGKEINPSPLSSPSSSTSGELSPELTCMPVAVVPTPSWILPNSYGRQLVLLWHASLTYFLWILVTCCAIKSPSLGDVLDLVGAFTGTLLAFILPALFSLKLRGHSRQSMLILVVGGFVGLLGTATSLIKFIKDSST